MFIRFSYVIRCRKIVWEESEEKLLYFITWLGVLGLTGGFLSLYSRTQFDCNINIMISLGRIRKTCMRDYLIGSPGLDGRLAPGHREGPAREGRVADPQESVAHCVGIVLRVVQHVHYWRLDRTIIV